MLNFAQKKLLEPQATRRQWCSCYYYQSFLSTSSSSTYLLERFPDRSLVWDHLSDGLGDRRGQLLLGAQLHPRGLRVLGQVIRRPRIRAHMQNALTSPEPGDKLQMGCKSSMRTDLSVGVGRYMSFYFIWNFKRRRKGGHLVKGDMEGQCLSMSDMSSCIEHQ